MKYGSAENRADEHVQFQSSPKSDVIGGSSCGHHSLLFSLAFFSRIQ